MQTRNCVGRRVIIAPRSALLETSRSILEPTMKLLREVAVFFSFFFFFCSLQNLPRRTGGIRGRRPKTKKTERKAKKRRGRRKVFSGKQELLVLLLALLAAAAIVPLLTTSITICIVSLSSYGSLRVRTSHLRRQRTRITPCATPETDMERT